MLSAHKTRLGELHFHNLVTSVYRQIELDLTYFTPELKMHECVLLYFSSGA